MSELPPLTAASLAEQGSQTLERYNVDTLRLPVTIGGNAGMYLPEVSKAVSALDPKSEFLTNLLSKAQESAVAFSSPGSDEVISPGLNTNMFAGVRPADVKPSRG